MQERLSTRRREALRLDLEDRQKALIEEVYRLSRGLIHGSSIPPCFGAQLLAGEVELPTGVAAVRLEAEVARLFDVSRTLARIDHADFGRCARCGELIPFSDLAQDATRRRCSGECDQAPPAPP